MKQVKQFNLNRFDLLGRGQNNNKDNGAEAKGNAQKRDKPKGRPKVNGPGKGKGRGQGQGQGQGKGRGRGHGRGKGRGQGRGQGRGRGRGRGRGVGRHDKQGKAHGQKKLANKGGPQMPAGVASDIQPITLQRRNPPGLDNLPEKHTALLLSSDLTDEEVTGNETAVRSLLKFYVDGPMKSQASIAREKQKALEIKTTNPFDVYEKSEMIGEGGMGKVFKSKNINTGKACALKGVSIEDLQVVR